MQFFCLYAIFVIKLLHLNVLNSVMSTSWCRVWVPCGSHSTNIKKTHYLVLPIRGTHEIRRVRRNSASCPTISAQDIYLVILFSQEG